MKNILASTLFLISSLAYATDIRPLIALELGVESGTLDDDYNAVGYVPQSYEHDYNGANFRLSGGIAIEHETVESRFKVYLESASGELEYDSSFNLPDEDLDSNEIGVSYDLISLQEGLKPFIGLELGTGSSELDVPGATKIDYSSFGLYGGLIYPINENLDFTARIGYKARYYDDYSEFVAGIGVVTEESEYSGVDLKVGLTYLF